MNHENELSSDPPSIRRRLQGININASDFIEGMVLANGLDRKSDR